jgi:hypothetical protein
MSSNESWISKKKKSQIIQWQSSQSTTHTRVSQSEVKTMLTFVYSVKEIIHYQCSLTKQSMKHSTLKLRDIYGCAFIEKY